MRHATTIAFVVVMAVFASCGSDQPPSDGTPSSSSAPPTSEAIEADGSASSGPSSGPSTPDEAAALVVDVVNGAMMSESDFEAAFGPIFRDSIGFADFSALVAEFATSGPWTLGAARMTTDLTGTYELADASGEVMILDISVSPTGEGIDGLFLSPDRVFEAPQSIDDAIARLESLGRLRAGVLDASNGACAPVVDAGAGEVMPLGSAFKLYVLGAVVKAMDDGSVGWETEVEIRDELDSLPSGTTQDVEAGTLMTVRELAELMISISDNTATDHLIDLVGRDAVEAMLVPMGNDAVERNLPFLTTRELFVLKFGGGEIGQRYLEADSEGRRSLLANDIADAPLPDLSGLDPNRPFLVEELEWFASPVAMCDAMVWLVADPTAQEILALNPGVPATSPTWDTIAYKGGSEPGLMTMVWWTSTEDGRAFVTAASVTSSTGPIDELEAANLFAFLRDEGPEIDEVGGSD